MRVLRRANIRTITSKCTPTNRPMLRSGKNIKALYYLSNYAQMLIPNCLFNSRLERILNSLDEREDKAYILDRVDYYCRLSPGATLPPEASTIGQQKMNRKKVYYFDSRRALRYFPSRLRFSLVPGDINTVCRYPSLVKSRPIGTGNQNNVLLKLNRVRHFVTVRDRLSFESKATQAIFRGKIKDKPLRERFFQRFFGNPLCDLGDTSRHPNSPQEWRAPLMSIYDQLAYKFILTLEGFDVASNLKWVMASNSLAIMPRPRCETWFMEGRLEGGVHYVEIRDDFSDLEEKIAFYSNHTDEAQRIIAAANQWAAQFRDSERERLISLLVLKKYFEATGQTVS